MPPSTTEPTPSWTFPPGETSRRFGKAIIANSPVPIGTVPIYEALTRVRSVPDLTADILLEVIEEQAEQGVDYMTIHAGILIQFLPLITKRITGVVSRGRFHFGSVDGPPPPAESPL